MCRTYICVLSWTVDPGRLLCTYMQNVQACVYVLGIMYLYTYVYSLLYISSAASCFCDQEGHQTGCVPSGESST